MPDSTTPPGKKKRGAEPEPADPDFADQRAGELQIGSYSHSWLYDVDRKLPPKHPFGFAMAVPVDQLEILSVPKGTP